MFNVGIVWLMTLLLCQKYTLSGKNKSLVNLVTTRCLKRVPGYLQDTLIRDTMRYLIEIACWMYQFSFSIWF